MLTESFGENLNFFNIETVASEHQYFFETI